ncbi:hypothetical protein SAMN05216174_104379 [Actinokineospora iranica]|uniref:MYXO-CTERM domain-containing protein n=2 Tax=Actinokineospora iranica TaxID=1271860 RepID=A0A1G6PPP7_9PSEU|nr:hypothetical protein SAMN05216174_104379 [Actinokineospora iranica]
MLCSALSALVLGALGAAPAAAEPATYLAVDCAQEVSAFAGQSVALARVAVADLVVRAVRETPGLGPMRAHAVGLTFPLGPALVVGEMPERNGEITGEHIGDVVADAVRAMAEVEPAPDAAAARVRELVAAECGLTMRPVNPKPDTGQPSPADPPAPPPATAADTAAPAAEPGPMSLFDPADRTAPRESAAPPSDTPTRTRTPDPTEAAPGPRSDFLLDGRGAAFHATGAAQSVPDTPIPCLSVPVMLAVLALSVASGALARAWVLRKG